MSDPLQTQLREYGVFLHEEQDAVDVKALQEGPGVEQPVRSGDPVVEETPELWPEFENEADNSPSSLWTRFKRPVVAAGVGFGVAVPVAVALFLILSSSTTEPPVRAGGGDAPTASPASVGEAPVGTEPASGATGADMVAGGDEGEGGGDGGEAPPLGRRSVARIDPETNQATWIDPGPGELLSDVVVGDGVVWAFDGGGRGLLRIDPETNTVVRRVELLREATNIAIGEGSMWVTNSRSGEDVLVDRDPKTGRVRREIGLGYHGSAGVVAGAGAVWIPVAGAEGIAVLRIEPTAGEVVATISLSDRQSLSGHLGVVVGEGAVWVAAERASVGHGLVTVWRIDPDTNEVVATVELPARSRRSDFSGGMAAGAGAVWVGEEGSLFRIDATTNRIVETIFVAANEGVAFGSGSVWAAVHQGGNVLRIDPTTNEVVATIDLGPGSCSCSVAVGAGGVWAD